MHTNLNFEEFARLVVPQPLDASWQPAFLQLSRSEAPHFIGLCRERQIVIIDAIDCQLSDLAMVSSSHRSNKSDSAKDAQIARFKERVRQLEAQVRSLKDENELLYGKLTDL